MSEEELEDKTEGEIEQLAEELGWNPDWEGPEEEKVSASDYIRRQQKILRQSSDDISSLRGNVDQLKSQMQKMAEQQGKTLTKALESQRQRLLEERDKAVEAGDTEAFKKADKQLNELTDEGETKEDPKTAAFQKGFVDFKSRNEWFEKDAFLTKEALSSAQTIGMMYPDISADEFYQKVEEMVKEAHPQKFAKPSNKPTEVSGDKPEPAKSKTKWDQLVGQHPEVKDIFAEFVKDGVFKDTKEDREKYANGVLEE